MSAMSVDAHVDVKRNVSRQFSTTALASNSEIWACKSRFYTQVARLKTLAYERNGQKTREHFFGSILLKSWYSMNLLITQHYIVSIFRTTALRIIASYQSP